MQLDKGAGSGAGLTIPTILPSTHPGDDVFGVLHAVEAIGREEVKKADWTTFISWPPQDEDHVRWSALVQARIWRYS